MHGYFMKKSKNIFIVIITIFIAVIMPMVACNWHEPAEAADHTEAFVSSKKNAGWIRNADKNGEAAVSTVMSGIHYSKRPEAVPAAPGTSANPAPSSEVAVINVAAVIDSSVTGKAGQAHLDRLRDKLDAEFKKYRASLGGVKDAESHAAQKRAEMGALYQEEVARVSDILIIELRRTSLEWLKCNKRGVKVLIQDGLAIAALPDTDVSAEILRLFNKVAIDFTRGENK